MHRRRRRQQSNQIIRIDLISTFCKSGEEILQYLTQHFWFLKRESVEIEQKKCDSTKFLLKSNASLHDYLIAIKNSHKLCIISVLMSLIFLNLAFEELFFSLK